ncbi:MAG TPA: GNAT family N-acetyltransferase [Pyrinomonadaceae bacterium]|nr:GNAT family N-acetyltransferase [Pyrinomonadaceae bacterium]
MTTQLQLNTLEYVSRDELAAVLNAVFADYFVKIELDQDQLDDKIALERIDLTMSAGAFSSGKLVGFILIGIAGESSYNGGTGVLPEFRGNGVTAKMYEFIRPRRRAASIRTQTLEVIRENTAAIMAYQKIGFARSRTLACFSGRVNISRVNNFVELRPLDDIDENVVAAFYNFSPSWQNSLAAFRVRTVNHSLLGAYLHGELVGFLIHSGQRVKQFAVASQHRGCGIGKTLFSRFAGQRISITNIDKCDMATCSFLGNLGLKLFLEQYEMNLII